MVVEAVFYVDTLLEMVGGLQVASCRLQVAGYGCVALPGTV